MNDTSGEDGERRNADGNDSSEYYDCSSSID